MMREMGAKETARRHFQCAAHKDLHERNTALMDPLHRSQDRPRRSGAPHHRQSGEDHFPTTIPVISEALWRSLNIYVISLRVRSAGAPLRIESRRVDMSNSRRRRFECTSCGHRSTRYEVSAAFYNQSIENERVLHQLKLYIDKKSGVINKHIRD